MASLSGTLQCKVVRQRHRFGLLPRVWQGRASHLPVLPALFPAERGAESCPTVFVGAQVSLVSSQASLLVIDKPPRQALTSSLGMASTKTTPPCSHLYRATLPSTQRRTSSSET